MNQTGFVRREDGAGALEFALIMPALIMFIFGIVQIGQMYSDSSALDVAVRKAGRLITLDKTVSQSALATSIKSNLNVSGTPTVNVSLTQSTTGGVTMANLSASMTRTYSVPLAGDYNMTFTSQTSVPTN